MPVDLSLLNGPIGGGLVALVSALSVFLLTQRHQIQLELFKDTRGLRDARRERLRVLYERTLLLVYSLRDTVHEPNDSDDGRRKPPTVREALLIRVQLGLEGEADVLNCLVEFLDLGVAAGQEQLAKLEAMALSGQPPPVGEFSATGVANAWRAQVDDKVKEIETLMRASLATLEKPIRALPPDKSRY